MNARVIAAAALLPLLCACAGGPPAPVWQEEAFAALEGYKKHYFSGDSLRAARDLAAARAAISSTGRLDLAARAELFRCAIGTAALDFEVCGAIEPLLLDADSEDRAYADFLAGRWEGLDRSALAARYRPVVEARSEQGQNQAAQQIDDPLSRIIAAGVLMKRAGISPATVAAAVEAASQEGLRRPVLAWLNVQARLAEAAGDKLALETIRRRI